MGQAMIGPDPVAEWAAHWLCMAFRLADPPAPFQRFGLPWRDFPHRCPPEGPVLLRKVFVDFSEGLGGEARLLRLGDPGQFLKGG